MNKCLTFSYPEVLSNVEHPSHINMFTDGGCEFPADYTARRGSWAVVADFSKSKEISEDATVQAKFDPTYKHPCMKCVATGLVSGDQTASRGEMIAILQAVRYANAC